MKGTVGGASPGETVRELIVIPEISNNIHMQHTIQQVPYMMNQRPRHYPSKLLDNEFYLFLWNLFGNSPLNS